MPSKVLAIVGSYRPQGTIDRAVDEILKAAESKGASIKKISLRDQQIEFCTNCRNCTQPPGEERGTCLLSDDMSVLLDEIESADAIVLGSPVNFGTVTARWKLSIERTICMAYWPWGKRGGPELRNKRIQRCAVVGDLNRDARPDGPLLHQQCQSAQEDGDGSRSQDGGNVDRWHCRCGPHSGPQSRGCPQAAPTR